MVFGLVGRQSMVGSGDPGVFGEHGSLCFKLPEILSILCPEKLKKKRNSGDNHFQYTIKCVQIDKCTLTQHVYD